MQRSVTPLAIILGLSILSGLTALGYLLGDAAIRYKQFERSVTVKGLSEREYKADIALWPIQFSAAANQLDTLYTSLESHTDKIRSFLLLNGIHPDEISIASPAITDKSAQTYGSNSRPEFRYSALQTVTVYSTNIEVVRNVMKNSPHLAAKASSLPEEIIRPRPSIFLPGLMRSNRRWLKRQHDKHGRWPRNLPRILTVNWARSSAPHRGSSVSATGIGIPRT